MDSDSDNASAVTTIRIAIYFATSGSQCMDYGQLAMITSVWKCDVVVAFKWNLQASVCFEMLHRPYTIVIGI